VTSAALGHGVSRLDGGDSPRVSINAGERCVSAEAMACSWRGTGWVGNWRSWAYPPHRVAGWSCESSDQARPAPLFAVARPAGLCWLGCGGTPRLGELPPGGGLSGSGLAMDRAETIAGRIAIGKRELHHLVPRNQ